jgi:hypothetical protein
MEQEAEAFASHGIRTKDLQRLCKGTDQTGYETDLVDLEDRFLLM